MTIQEKFERWIDKYRKAERCVIFPPYHETFAAGYRLAKSEERKRLKNECFKLASILVKGMKPLATRKKSKELARITDRQRNLIIGIEKAHKNAEKSKLKFKGR